MTESDTSNAWDIKEEVAMLILEATIKFLSYGTNIHYMNYY
jgi:hypothetical protein